MLGRKSKNVVLEKVTIEKMAAEGKCIARYENKVVFVENVAPGDVVDLRVFKVKSKFAEAEAIRFHSYSENRAKPFCEHFGHCGGCKWQHIPYAMQLAEKTQQVEDALSRIAKVEYPPLMPIIASKQSHAYRNKLDFTFSPKRWLTKEEIQSGNDFEKNALGFHIRGSFDKILDIDTCHLMEEPINAIRNRVKHYGIEKGLPFYDLREHQGFLRNLIFRNTSTGELMVILQVGQDKKEWLFPLLDTLIEDFPQITSLHYIVNRKLNETYYDQEVICYHGKTYITEEMEGLKFRVSPKSFYQTNALQAYELYKVARDFAGLTGKENVYDLYTGTGTIANFVAKQAKQVVGIESVPEAIDDARLNSEINHIGNTLFYAGDMKDMLNADFIEKHGKPDVIITDPPRSGMHNDVLKVLSQSGAEKIVYVSCNPATQARDLALLDEVYKIVKIQPVDMFPQTTHVENVVLLELRSK
jgi:23S rRNA (uracil1939-C5)-methyltransferase